MNYKKRTLYLILGQIVSALGIVGMMQANIGLDPWNCLHQGMSNVTGLTFGTCTIIVGAIAILISFLLKEPLSLGTVVNVLCPGILIDFIQAIRLIPQMDDMWSGLAMMVVGQAVLALGTYFYMAAAMGAGPRDALMVAVSRPLRLPVGACRTVLEVLAVFLGWRMGAKVGIGTVFSALTIGIFLQAAFGLFHFDPKTIHHDSFPQLWRAFRGWVKKEPPVQRETTEEETKDETPV